MKRFLLVSVSALALSTAPASADPISLAVAAISTAGAVIGGGGIAATTFTAFGLSLTGLAAVGAQFAVRAALGYALNALTAKSGGATGRGFSTTVNALGTSLPHQIIYGETRVGGAVFYQALTSSGANQDRFHRFIAFAGHEIDSYQAIYLDGIEVTIDGSGNVTAPSQFANQVRIKQYLGTSTQTADTDAISELTGWTVDHRARGVAYLYVRFEDASKFPNGVPTVTAKIRGKKVEDTRTSTTAWSDNPAMIMRDYLLSDYGLSESAADINETLFEAAADLCDEDVSGAKRYTCNGAFTLDASPEDIIRNILSSMGGIFWNYQGQWAVQAAEYITPTLTLTGDDLRGPIEVATRHSRRDNFNSIKGQYKGAETDYQADDYSIVTGPIFLSEDNGIPAVTDLDLLFTDTEIMAQRIARTALRRNRFQQTVSAAFGLRALDLKIGDNVMLTIDHLGYSSKVFEVVDWRLGMKDLDIQVNMILREMDETVFTGIVDTLQDESGNILQDESGNNLEAIAA